MQKVTQGKGKVKPRDTRPRRIVGVCAMARELGVSRTSIYEVARGLATSARIEAYLREHNVKVAKRRA